jgi:hypothetical protein
MVARQEDSKMTPRKSFLCVARLLGAATLALVTAGAVRADVAATGTFGIDIDVNIITQTGTFDGEITGFNAGPFSVGGTPVDLAGNVGTMNIVNGNIPSFNIPALAANFNFDATSPALTFEGEGIAVCSTNIIDCAAGQATFVGDITSLTDGSNLLPDGYVYTFDGTGGDNPGPGFDAIGNFGINGFLPVNVPAGNPVTAASDPTSFYDSRSDVLRNFLIDVTFAEVTNPGTIAFLGKSAISGALPANIAVQPDVSVFVDIVTGNGLAFTPPVDVCVAYDDSNPADGIVDGTGVAVNELKLLHALALGQNFQDVTTSVGGGKLCGQVGSLSPFLVAVGPPLVTTTTLVSTTSTTVITTTSTSVTTVTTFTTTTTSTSTTTSTLPGGLVPGGPTSKASSDCYLELVVAGVQNTPPQVEDGKKILCTDGDPCDLGPCGDNICNMRAGVCINQTDPNLPECTPPAGLDKVTVKNKIAISVPSLLEGPQCGAIVDFEIEAKFNGAGKYLAKKSKQSLKGKAKAPKGTSPRSDADKWTITCQPRADACPGSASGAFLDGDGRVDSASMR